MIDARPVASKMFSIRGFELFDAADISRLMEIAVHNWIGGRIAMSRSASEQVAAVVVTTSKLSLFFPFFVFSLSLVYGFFRESFQLRESITVTTV